MELAKLHTNRPMTYTNFENLNSVQILCKWGLPLLLLLSFAVPTLGQDAVYKYRKDGKTSRVSGRITGYTTNGITIDGTELSVAEIKKAVFSKEPPEVDRARNQMESRRYADAMAEVAKIKGNMPKDVAHEIDFINAFCSAQISLRGGNIVPGNAGKEVSRFISTYKNSYHMVPAVDQFARLAFAAGRPQVALDQFKKLQGVSWPEYQIKGYFQAGEMQILLGDLSGAANSFNAILANKANDDLSQTYKSIATCELARIKGLQGDAGAQKAIEAIIKKENPDNKKLFAYLYNALGSIHEKAGRHKEAARAYLHTELLYASESEAHAEALYHLALIWPKIEETDRASRARDTIKSRYRNSYWAGKL